MSFVSGVAAAAVSASQAEVKLAVAAKIAKMNAESEASVATLIESASQNLQQVVKSATAPGVGGNLDISA